MTQQHNADFVAALFDLTVLIETKQLSTPLAISWRRRGLDADEGIAVQVDERSFASWADQIGEHDAVVTEHQDELHIHACGHLHNGRVLHLVTVADKREQVTA